MAKNSWKATHVLGCVLILMFLAVNMYFQKGKMRLGSEVVNSSPPAVLSTASASGISAPTVRHEQPLVTPLSAKAEVNSASPPSSSILTKHQENTKSIQETVPSVAGLQRRSMSWSDFTRHSSEAVPSQRTSDGFQIGYDPIICSADIDAKLQSSRLSDEDFKWCTWALSPQGANVVVGKSWGSLRKPEQQRFDKLSCNSVSAGKNPSCDDSWGDQHIRQWRHTEMNRLQCDSSSRSSEVHCMNNENSDVYCELHNAMIDFSKVHKYDRPGTSASKKFEQAFLSTDCSTASSEPTFPFPHLYSPKLAHHQCDVVYNGTLLVYSHDDIRNLGHTLNDVMNVWIMLWMSGLARQAKSLDMLNIDSFKLGHNFNDEPNSFFLTYRKALHDILRGVDFQGKTLCVSKLLIQPTPPRFFIWESWFVDMPCSFIGPSSLYQRWNLHVRNEWQLTGRDLETEKKFTILLIVRNEHSNMWGNQRTSRNFLNKDELERGLKTFVSSLGSDYELIVQDLSTLKFEQQLQLLSKVSLMVGMHGAGIASSMHMSIGTKNCCGVLEIYARGEFFPILGHGNMARKMGLHYDRLDLSEANSQSNGANVPVKELTIKIQSMINGIRHKPTCIRRQVLEDPYLEK